MKKLHGLGLFLLALAACGGPKDPTRTADTTPITQPASGPNPTSAADAEPRTAPAAVVADGPALPASAPLTQRIDCLRERGGLLVVAHRGGPTRDFPENAIETLARTHKAGAGAAEIDVATSKDGVLFLMHDDTLDRTTTVSGAIGDKNWAEISKLSLRTYSKTTDFHPPTLQAALEWAVANQMFLEVDRKKSTGFEPIIAAIRAAKAEQNLLLITYTDDEAAQVHRLAPDLMITALVDDPSDLDRLAASGVKLDHLIAWTGTSRPDKALWTALAARGVESAFGTLGRRGERLDDVFWEDRDGSEYDAMMTPGLVLLPTDFSDKVSRQLSADDSPAQACGF